MSRVLFLLFIAALAHAARAEEFPPPASAEKRADAELHDVFFIDLEQGWAVGDRGAIWHTIDGGRHWQLQDSPTGARLSSVCFLDGQNGWAAGGFTHPLTHLTTGVLLRTTNGGGTWQPVAGLLVPALEKIKFFDAQHGWAVALPSAMYPSGLLRTDDGGRSFTAVQGPAAQGRLVADGADPTSGFVLQEGRGVFTLSRTELSFLAPPPATGLRGARALKLAGRECWLAGEGGLLLHSPNGGRSWQAPETPLPEGAESLDFHTIAAVGNQLWAAGSPGSVILHSTDRGRTWTRQLTGHTLPLSAITFADENHGWAVGALGTILITRDGGQTWRKSRAGGEHVALLGLFAEPQNISWELIARECGEEGHLTAVECLQRRDLDNPVATASRLSGRTAEAMAQLGGSGFEFAWQFPLRERGLELPLAKAQVAWHKENVAAAAGADRAALALEAHLVRSIRQWRPEVIVTEPLNEADATAAPAFMHRAVLNAVEKASDSEAFPELAAALALSPWRVKKVFSALPPGAGGTITLNTAQLALRLGRSLADEGLAARALVATELTAAPPTRSFQLLADRVPGGSGKRDLFDGLSLTPGSETRRVLGAPVRQDLAALKQLATQRANIEQLLSRSPAETTPATLAANLADLTRGLGDENAGQVLFQLADHYRRAGRSEFAAATYAALVERYPRHTLTEAALVWLVHHYASAEEMVRLKLPVADETQLARLDPARQVLAPPDGAPPEPVTEVADKLSPPKTSSARWQRARQYLQQLERTRPALYAQPEVRFPLAAIQRSEGQAREAAGWFEACAVAPGEESWRSCAQAELWLKNPESVCTKLTLRCPKATARPKLDGRLDEPLWQTAALAELKSAYRDDAQWPAVARLARDDEFLYLAATCRRAPGAAESTLAPVPRARDADLSRADRVEFNFDIDRDYATSFRLALDERGLTQESCHGDASWNPRWFVARSGDAATWTVEAAIPLAELAQKTPAAGDAWALGIARILPSTGFQSWNRPAGVQCHPAGFGLLVFE